MKTLIYAIYAFFICLLAVTIVVAVRYYDGLVEEGYYEKSLTYLKDREREEAMGVRVHYPGYLEAGVSQVTVSILENGGPFRGGVVRLHMGRPGGEEHDRIFVLLEGKKGEYTADIGRLEKGEWICTLEIGREDFRASRRWSMGVR